MPPVVVTDADVLFGGTTRALFIFLDYAGCLRLHWSPRILTEMSIALVGKGRKPDMDAARAHERQMNEALGNALLDQSLVDRHEAVLSAYVNDSDDAHVAACAYELLTGGYYTGAAAVVLATRNLNDFRTEELARLGIAVLHPDEFLIGLPLAAVASAFRAWRLKLPVTQDAERLLGRLGKDGNVRIASALRDGAAAGRFDL